MLPPSAGNEENELLDPDQDRADKGEDGYLGILDGQLHMATVGRHGDGDAAAIRLIREAHWWTQSTGPMVEYATGTVWGPWER